MEVKGEERHRERAEICLENGRDAADVVEAVRVAEVEGSVVAAIEQLRYSFGLA